MKNISLKSKLLFSYLTLGFFLIAISILSIIFVVSTGKITYNLLNHPYTVTNAIKDVEIGLFDEYLIAEHAYHQGLLDDNEMVRVQALNDSNQNDFTILYERYLGSLDDIRIVEADYNVIHGSIIDALNYIDNGNLPAADLLLREMTNSQISGFISLATPVKNFAENKAIEYENQITNIRDNYTITISVVTSVLIITSFFFGMIILKDLNPTIDNIMKTIESFKKGEDENSLDLNRKDEFGTISNSMNQMFEVFKTQQEIERLNAKLQNLRDQEHLRVTLMSIGDGVITTDMDGIITNINPVASRITEFDPIESIGRQITEVFKIVHKKTGKRVDDPIQEVFKNGRIRGLANHAVLVSKSGKKYDISDSASPIKGDNGEQYGIVLVFRDVTEEYKKQQKIEYLSFHDSLTGLYNRNYLDDKFAELEKNKAEHVAILMGDVNGLKITNDAFGHAVGDELLQEVSRIIQTSIKDHNSTAVRWGGDEFVIVLENVVEKDIIKIIENINNHSFNADLDIPLKLNITFGYAIKNGIDANLYKTLIRSEDMMYENKLLEKDSLRSAIVASLQSSLFEKSFETEEHAIRVGKYATLISKRLGLTENKINEVVLLSRLHDIGKIAIDDEILLKPGPLNDEEWKIIKRHPETGFRIASNLSDLSHIAEGILSHHERYDGDGYPRNLKGEDIPLDARIIAIADSFDVMTSDRSYKKKMSLEDAIKELIRCKGTQFDPKLIDMFIEEIIKPRAFDKVF